MSLSAFLEYTVTSLYIDGNAFWMISRSAIGEIINITPLNPAEVSVLVETLQTGDDTITFAYRGEIYDDKNIINLQLLRIPGKNRGLGPIQAAQIEVKGALDARDYGALWLSDSTIPDGVLTTDQELAPGDAEKYRNVWYGKNPDGSERENQDVSALHERIRILGKGLEYTPLLLKPSDVQFLESQQYNTLQITRLIGAPASIMLVSPEGSAQSYQNVEQEWIAYIRFGLMKALREIEEAFSALLPGKIKARFKLDALLRTDTKARYEAYSLSLNAQTGWATLDEIRQIEGLPELTDEQRRILEQRRGKNENSTQY